MKYFKKWGIVSLVAVMSCSLMIGCAKKSDDNVSPSASTDDAITDTSAPEESVLEIEFFQAKQEATEIFDTLIAQFTELNPNVKVIQNTVPDAQTVIVTRAATNDMPDVATMYPQNANTAELVAGGHFKDLQDSAALNNVKDSYREALTQETGEIYGIPLSMNFQGVFYNKDLFEAQGYEEPTTWSELIDIAKDIKARGETAFLMSNKDSWTISNVYLNIVTKNTGDFYTSLYNGAKFSEGDYLEGLEKVLELVDYAQADTLSLGYDQSLNDFANGKAYMLINGSWITPSILSANPDANFGIFPMPNDSGDMKQQLWPDVTLYAGINKDSDTKATAVEDFLAFMASTEAAQTFADMDHSPSAIEGVTDKLERADSITQLIAENSVLDISRPRTGFSLDTYMQQLIVDQNVQEFADLLDQEWNAAS